MQSYNLNHSELESNIGIMDVKQDFLRRTIEVKNKNIDELLKQLKETQELYQAYKASYLAEEQKLKSKVAQLNEAYAAQGSELERQKHLTNKLKGQLQALVDREQKMVQNHMVQSKEHHCQKRELEDKCRELMRQNTELKNRNQGLANRYVIMQERCLQSERNAATYRQELKLARQQIEDNKSRWAGEKKQLIDRLQQQELRKQGKQKVNRKLDALQQKILQTMRKI